MIKPDSPVQVVWFKRDLRSHDHAALAQAARAGAVLPLYLIEPELWQLKTSSQRHWEFIRGSLQELEQELARHNLPLIYRTGEAIEVLQSLHNELGPFTLWSHMETGNAWTFARDKAVQKWCRALGIKWNEPSQFGVIRGMKDRDVWTKFWEQMMHEPQVQLPAEIVPALGVASDALPSALELDLSPDRGTDIQSAGRKAGWQTLESFFAGRGEGYQKEMSSPVTGFDSCSRLSPYLTYGCLSMREVLQYCEAQQQEILNRPAHARGKWPGALRALISRLHWHCHFIQKLESDPSIEWQSMIPQYDDIRPSNPDWLAAWEQGRTGYPLIDACMRAVRGTGYLNFRMRALVVSFASYHLWLPWQQTSPYLARMFTDYEPGIHYSQFQMQSGVTGINSVRVYNPIKQSYEQDPAGEFIKQWVPELTNVPTDWVHEPWRMPPLLQREIGCVIGEDYPAPLVDEKSASRSAKAKIFELRKDPELKRQAKGVYQKLGSRRSPAIKRQAAARRNVKRNVAQQERAAEQRKIAQAQGSLFDET